MSNIINLQIDEGSSFTKVLTFTKEVKKGEYVHPITKKVDIIKEREPIDLSDYKVVAQIRTEPRPDSTLISDFNADLISADKGIVAISLTKEQTLTFGNYIGTTGLDTERVFTLGYYDIILISPSGKVTRAFEGKCYLNRSTTDNPFTAASKNVSMNTSPATDPSSETELYVDPSKPYYSVGLRYFNGGVPKTPTGGVVKIYRMPKTTQVYNKEPMAIISATNVQAEVSWKGNTERVKAVPENLNGISTYQLAVVSNAS